MRKGLWVSWVWACVLGAAEGTHIVRESGVVVAAVQARDKRPMPEHKVQMLQDHWGYGRRKIRRLGDEAATGQVPLHAGYGTHYAFLYVGTPPQRVSVILDTGSHWTAFPCTGCRQCGDHHTDPAFDITKSSTYHELACNECQFSSKCQSNKCTVSLSYAEGSRWDAYEAKDVVWLGGDNAGDDLRGGQGLSMPFVFGCQTYETGLFRTQLEDGIMGLSNQDLTIVPKLKENTKISERTFGLCLTGEGGTLRLGGYDTGHLKSPLQFVPLAKSSGWYTVKVTGVRIGGHKLDVNMDLFNNGQGTIVDSGTTDTYLPRQIAGPFTQLYQKIAKISYSSDRVDLGGRTPADLPDVTFVFENGVEASMPATSYLECDDDSYNSCAGSIFLDNSNGAVLGANFMLGREVVFDIDRRRVGFAPADCSFEAAKANKPSSDSGGAATTSDGGTSGGKDGEGAQPTPATHAEEDNVDCGVTYGQPVGKCDAVCPEGATSGVAVGRQDWSTIVSTQPKGDGTACPTELLPRKRPCVIQCGGSEKSGEVEVPCEDNNAALHWSDCSADCKQTASGRILQHDGSCTSMELTRECSVGKLCERAMQGYFVDFSLGFKGAQNGQITSQMEQSIVDQVSYLLQMPAGDVEVLQRSLPDQATVLSLRLHLPSNSSSEYTQEHKVLSPGQKAAEVNATVRAPPFALALGASLKESGGAFQDLQAVELMSSSVASFGATRPNLEAGRRHSGPIRTNVLVLDVIGGSAAVLLLVGLIVHFRWSHWQNLTRQQPGSILDRLRQNGETGAPAVGTGTVVRPPKPNTRSYSRVESNELGRDPSGVEEVEMI